MAIQIILEGYTGVIRANDSVNEFFLSAKEVGGKSFFFYKWEGREMSVAVDLVERVFEMPNHKEIK